MNPVVGEIKTNPEWEWNTVFGEREWGKYPPEEVIRFVARNFYQVPKREEIRFLDLGCGTGANTWFLAREGFSVDGIDASSIGIEQAKKRLSNERLTANFEIGKLQELPYPDDSFHAMIDNASITCNTWDESVQILKEVQRVLRPKGKYWGLFFGNKVSIQGFQKDPVNEPSYYEKITLGSLRGCPSVRLYTPEELRKLFQDFEQVKIDYVFRTDNDQEIKTESWLVTAIWPG